MRLGWFLLVLLIDSSWIGVVLYFEFCIVDLQRRSRPMHLMNDITAPITPCGEMFAENGMENPKKGKNSQGVNAPLSKTGLWNCHSQATGDELG